MKKLLLTCLLGAALTGYAQQVFINEIHYDNSGADTGEGVEIAGPAGTDLTDYDLIFYNGNGGTVYDDLTLSGVLTDQSNGFGFAFFAISGIQNGAPDGIALTYLDSVIQFLSYEGIFLAVGGPAAGLLSQDIGVTEDSGTPVGFSLQLWGSGTNYSDFFWQMDTVSTYGAANIGQSFETPPITHVWINEIHYDNAGADMMEGIELAGPIATGLGNYTLVLYNGANGTIYDQIGLPVGDTIPFQQNGYGTKFYSINGIQNGAPDGVALVYSVGDSTLVQFLSYEGSFMGVEGPAAGIMSEDIGVTESSSTPVNFSLQLTGGGFQYSDFSWAPEMTQTYDSVNTNQCFGACPVDSTELVDCHTIWINEIHYDNTGADMDEGVELAGVAGTALGDYTIVLYNGVNGQTYQQVGLPFTDTIPNHQNGYGTKFYPISGIQNGSPDGIALVYSVGADTSVVQFLSYEGGFIATEGPAIGMFSDSIFVEESSSTPIGFSLQLVGEGTSCEDFTWSTEIPHTYDSVNTGQSFGAPPVVAFINEIHYDNDGTDLIEGVEIAGTAGLDVTGWSIILYNGNGGAVYATHPLSGIIPDLDNGYGVLSFAIGNIQNGGPDGIALVMDTTVIQFLSYEGSFTAVGGPADGMMSEDIGVNETSSTPVGFSLQLIGTGNDYSDFVWTDPISQTFGAVNTGQSFGGIIVNPPSDTVTIAVARTLPLFTEVVVSGVITVSNQFGGPAYIQDSTGGIPIFDAEIHGDGNYSIGDSVILRASVDAFNLQVQLSDIDTLVDLGPANLPITPLSITLSELAAHEGELVSIAGITFDDPSGLLYPNSNFIISDLTGSAQLRIDDNTELAGMLKPQSSTTATGVVGRFQSNVQLLPRFQPDLPEATPYVPEGSDIPVSQTLDVATWNMEFFGTTIPNFGPSDVELQKNNAIQVIQALHADIIAVQEVSNDSLLDEVVASLPGFQRVCSDVYSRSWEVPDPNDPFPPQKLCFLFDTSVIELVAEQVIFDQLYTDARLGLINDLDDHPGSSGAQSFWSSGRLPYMVTVNATIGSSSQQIRLINIHAKSGAGGNDQDRRVYDMGVLKDTLDVHYSGDQVILLGDYNDDVDVSIGGGPSTYQVLVDDSSHYHIPTGSLSELGLRSYLFADNMIDHITITDDLFDNLIAGSENTFLPFTLIANYSGTTSDHLPVTTRYDFGDPLVVEVNEDQLVYHGYAPEETAELSVTVSGGSGSYSYLWSTGETTETITVSPEDTTVYSVTVIDSEGGFGTDSVTVSVVDVECHWRGHQKVSICYEGRSYCIPSQHVAWWLSRGATLGDCPEIESVVGAISASPNPFNRQFDLSVECFESVNIWVMVFNLFGYPVYHEVVPMEEGENTLTIDLGYAWRGLYVVKVINADTGDFLKSIRVVKRF